MMDYIINQQAETRNRDYIFPDGSSTSCPTDDNTAGPAREDHTHISATELNQMSKTSQDKLVRRITAQDKTRHEQ